VTHRLAGALWLLLACSALAAPRIKGEVRYEPFAKIVLKASDVSSAKAQFLWDVDGNADYVDAGETLYVWAAPGKYRVTLTAVDFDAKKVERAKFSFQVGDVPPTPTPGPGPRPPDPPGPAPGPAPIDAPGLRVLIVFESAERAKMPPAQDAILSSTTFRSFLNSVCADDPQTGTKKAWWMLDKDADVSGLAAPWQAAMKRPRAALPWIIVSNKDRGTGFEGPLPADVDKATELVKKYAATARRR
jgi:hypothetical protein